MSVAKNFFASLGIAVVTCGVVGSWVKSGSKIRKSYFANSSATSSTCKTNYRNISIPQIPKYPDNFLPEFPKPPKDFDPKRPKRSNDFDPTRPIFVPSKNNNKREKFPVPTFEIKNLSLKDQDKIKKFKNTFEYWGNILKYDDDAGEEIDKKANSDVPFDKWQENHPELNGAKNNALFFQLYGEELDAAVVKHLIESKKGVCRHFARLLMEKGRNIGLDIYFMGSKNHAANLYKLDGKWYVADLTAQVCQKDKDSEWNYRVPLDYYLKVAMHVKDKSDRKNIKIWLGYHTVLLDEFLKTH